MKSALLFLLIAISALNMPAAIAEPLEKVKMQLSWRHQFQFAGFYAALQQGFYEKAGLDVTLLEGGPGTNCNETLLLKQAQYCNAPGSVVQRRVEGEKVVVLASIIQYSPLVLLTLKESGFNTPKSLIGKRVESMLGGEPIVEIKAMFQREGIDLALLENLENSFNLDGLINKTVDAKFAFISNEPHQLDLAGIDYNVIRPSDYGIDFYGDVIMTSEQEIDAHEERAQRFKAATIEGWRYALANKAAIVDHIIADYDKTKNKAALLAEAKAIEALMHPKLIEIGHNNVERWEATAATLASIKAVESDYSLEGFVYQDNTHKFNQKMMFWIVIALLALSFGFACLWLYSRCLANQVQHHIQGNERLKESQKVALKQAYTDELSGMGNRRSCYEYGAQAVDYAKRRQEPISIVMIDIDHFKKVNDKYGHAVGDEVICAMAGAIIERIRETDIQGRIGGEEFAIILPDTDLIGAEFLAEGIRLEIENIGVVVGDEILRLTASFGAATLLSDSEDINVIMKRADKALYQAKESGRNKVIAL